MKSLADAKFTAYGSSALAPVFGFGLYIILAQARDTETLTNAVAFSALTLFTLLDIAMHSLVTGSEDLTQVMKSFQRIQKHLMETEQHDFRLTELTREPPTPTLINLDPISEPDRGISASLQNATAAWSVDSDPVLTDLSFDVATGKTTMIVGPVGCGKSTLLRVLLGEIPECTVTISTAYKHAAYCSQAPWITFGTIQQNIVGGSAWDRSWYDRVIQACALQTDLQQLPAGDQTKAGVRGSRLSGGQQIRVVSYEPLAF